MKTREQIYREKLAMLNDCIAVLGDPLNSYELSRKMEYEKEKKELVQKYERNLRRRMNDQAMRDMGLTKVKGALGGVYWE